MKKMKTQVALSIVGALAFGTFSNALASESCHIGNYRDYIFNQTKTEELIRQTGEGCQLPRITLRKANLSGAILIRANLRGAYLAHPNLINANLTEANLAGAEISWAEFNEAILIGANFAGADLSWADFSGADLTKANFSGASFHSPRYNRHTKFPDGFDIENAEIQKEN